MNARLLKRGLVALSLSALMALAVGCGSDNNPADSGGSMTDPAFVEVQPEVNTFIDSVFVAFSAGLSSHNEVPITDGQIRKFYGPGIPGGTNQSTYEYTAEGWHHITLAANDNVTIVGINDSIQFRNNQTAQQAPAGADVLDYRHHWAITPVDQTSDFATMTGDVGYVFSGLNSTSAIISGSYGFSVNKHTVDTSAIVTDNNFAFSSTANVSIAQPAAGIWGSGCPSDGNVTFSVAQTRIVTNGSAMDTTSVAWTGSATFLSGVATVRVTDGTTSWTYSRSVCSPAL